RSDRPTPDISPLSLHDALPISQIAAGRLADTFGRRRVVLLGLIAFIAGSIAAGTAQSIGWLIAARALQGLGTALSFVASLAIVRDRKSTRLNSSHVSSSYAGVC